MKKNNQNQPNPSPNLGRALKLHLKESKTTPTKLGALLNRSSSNVSQYLKRESFQTQILWDISHALQYNFFADLAAQLPEHFAQHANAQTQKMKALTTENELLKRDVALLQKVLAIRG